MLGSLSDKYTDGNRPIKSVLYSNTNINITSRGKGRSRTVLESFSVKQEHNDQLLDLMEPW